MKIVGIIAEYNPFHLGHVYQINKIKELYPDSLIIAIISGHYTERGDISIINKWDKTKICLDNNIDLVIELPTLYAIQSADMFAYGAINILQALHIDTIVFGTESDSLESIKKVAKIAINNPEYESLIKDYLKQGVNYPTAKSKALYELTGILIDKPNDLLALSYLKEIYKNNYPIEPIAIIRTTDYHSKEIKSNIVNASLIRDLIKDNQDVTKYLPPNSSQYLNKGLEINKAYPLLMYNLMLNKDNLNEYLMVDEGIENRILKSINKSTNWEELVMNIKTKRYTYNKIKRILIAILLNIRKSDNNNETYLRILGFTNAGRNYLNKIKKDLSIPIFTSYKPNKLHTLDLEFKSTYIYSIITGDLTLIKKEYQNKPIIK